jgi:ABC-type transport system substrate-binding protein
MNALKIALLVTIAVLLLVVVVDRMREPAQMQQVQKSLDRMAEATRAQTEEMRNLRQVLEARPVAAGPAVATSAPAAAAVANDPARDGNPRLGANFLLPYDRSWQHREWIGGNIKTIAASPKGLNPLTENSAESSSVHGLCNDSLCDRPPTSPEQWMEGLAESVVISDDYQTYTFRIRPGVRWHRPVVCAGKPEFAWLDKDIELTSADFKFTIDLIQDATVDCPQIKVYYEDLAGAACPDARTLVLKWKRPIFTSLSFSMGLQPTPRHIYGRNRDGSPIPPEQVGVVFNKHWFDELRGVCGVGSYILESFEPDKVMAFRRNPAYWGATLHFERLEWVMDLKRPDPQLVAFKNGQIHSHGLSPLQYKSEVLDRKEPRFAAADPANPKAGRTGELGWEKVKGLSFRYLGWNMRKPPFDDRRVRQAMSYCFPKERVIRDVFFGLGCPVSSDVHPDSQYCNRALKPFSFDPARAKALLTEAGWSDTDGDGVLDKLVDGKRIKLAFTIKYGANSPENDNMLAVYRNELKSIGVAMINTPFEWKELLRIFEDKDFEAIVGGWQMDWDIDYFQLWHSSQANLAKSSNHCGFANKRVDELAEKLRLTFDTKARIAIAQEIQAIIHEEQPYTFLWSGEGIFVWQNRAPAGSTEKDRWLDGVTKGLDTLHPLVNRSRLFWHFAR